MSDVLRVTDDGAVRLVTFARPEKLNAFNAAVYRALAEALADAREDDSVRVVVITGEGRAFSAGQDLGEMAAIAATKVEGDATARAEATKKGFVNPDDLSGFTALMDSLALFDKPLLAAVNGVGIGIGATILAHCDMALIAASARLRTPFAELGVTAEAASSYLFPLRMGWQRAAAVLIAGEWLSAEQAVTAGLALEVVPDDEVLDRTMALAARVATAPLASLRALKGSMLAAHADAIAAARAREDAAFAHLLRGFTV